MTSATASSAAPIDLRTCRADTTSQGGENGVLDAIFRTIGVTNKVCVEFGAYDLRKNSNVFPLWKDAGWHAILIEGLASRYRTLAAELDAMRARGEIAGSVDLVNRWLAVSGPDSLDAILDERLGVLAGSGRAVPNPLEPDLVSIDIDGLDYYVMEGLTRYRPRVIVVEINPSIPPHMALVGAAKGNFVGSSARAFCDLAKTKGYALATCTMCNCIFVQKQYADRFVGADDLDAHFDPSSLVYAISTFDGGVFYSARPGFGFRPFSPQFAKIDRPAGAWIPPQSVWYYIAQRFDNWRRRIKAVFVR